MKEKKQIPSLVKDEKLIKKRRDEMIDAAVSLFIQSGYHKTTTREIANQAGFSIGTLYEYIQSKEDILYLVCDAIHQELEERLLEAVQETEQGIELLKAAMKHFILTMSDMQDRVLLMYQEAKSLPRDTISYVLNREEKITEIFEGILHRGIEDGSIQLDQKLSKLMAHNIVVLCEMWAFRRWALAKHFSLEEFIETQTRLIVAQVNIDNKS